MHVLYCLFSVSLPGYINVCSLCHCVVDLYVIRLGHVIFIPYVLGLLLVIFVLYVRK